MRRRRERRGGAWRLRAVAPLALALLAGACDRMLEPGVGAGYDFALPVGEAVVYRWPAGSTIGVYVAGGAGERGELLGDAFGDAARDWEAALSASQVQIRRASSLGEADVVLRWSDVEPPVDTTGCEPRVVGRAATTFCWTPDRRGIRVFPSLDDSLVTTAQEGGPDEPARWVGASSGGVRMVITVLAEEARGVERVRQLVAHELGHMLGIGRHSSDPEDLMWEGALQVSRPTVADRATVRRLYETIPDVVP